ncbi:DUF935 family protein [Zobellia galactanivorans]|uniref:phage portal protein family protein n=1 Tax=Zobellia galactanivorans (strain DSM 12802 / CCUG 47099 / CIP 106680 / NCIMB 13871 / Dsij) TaxID=63186 RepID=UPI0026E4848A|nr:DUF935 family protein [Zobellia galactanivorans]MDO6808095.1 DUF935 family protein [Zobellia galactanivorans]
MAARRNASFKARKKKVKEPGNAPPQVIVHQVDVTQRWNRKPQEIPDWRKAVQSAESAIPRRQMLYNLYADVDLDGHVEAVTGKRRDAIKDANWKFVDNDGQDIDEVNEIIDSIGFDDMLEEIINSKFWGYSILEPRFWKDHDGKWEMDAGLIHRLFYRPELGVVAYHVNGDEGIYIREGIYARTIMEVGKVNDLGLYMKAAPYSILKRGGLGDYAMFIQTFGNPLIDAQWDGYDEKSKLQLKQGLEEMGRGGTLIRPKGTEVDLLQNSTKDTGDAHGNFLKFLNGEISKALLGTTETTESSGSSGYAQSKTHSEQDERKHDNDITFVRKVLNSRFMPILNAAGINTRGGRFVVQGEETELRKTEMFDIHLKMAKEMGVPIDHDFLYETYGAQKPDNYDEIMKQLEAKPEHTHGDPGKTDEEEPELKNKEGEEVKLTEQAWYLKLFDRLFPSAPASETVAGACSGHLITLTDEEGLDSSGLIRRVWNSGGKGYFDYELFSSTAHILIGGFRKGWDSPEHITLVDAPGFTYNAIDPAMLIAYEQNLFQFSAAKTLAEVQALNQLFRESGSFEEFYEKAMAQGDVFNKEWLATEYTTAVLTGEAASTYHRLVKQAHIFPYWMYKTAGDHLVRPAHRTLEDIVLPWDDKRWDKLFPPNGWRCRCYVVPRMAHEVGGAQVRDGREMADEYLKSAQGKKETATGWGVNRAASGEVFTKAQQYVAKFPGKASKKIDDLRFHDFGLKSYSQARKVATSKMKPYEGTADDILKDVDELEGKQVLRDYHERPLELAEKALRNRKRLTQVSALQEALKNPDEVWMNGKELGQIVYVKYYQGKTFIALGSAKKGELKLINWFELNDAPGNINDYRKGLLILK